MDWVQKLDWEFIVGDIVIPIATFVIGIFVGKNIEKKKAKSKINGDRNTVIQNSSINK